MQVFLLSAVIAVFGLNQVYGHSGDRLYPFYEIPDEAALDVTDGSIEDWEDLFGEPSLTSLDFTGFTSYQGSGVSMEYNPSDLDFRIYLGWNGTDDRIYVGAICIDDVYVGEDERSFNYFSRGGEDHVSLAIDSDHDGSVAWGDDFVYDRQRDDSGLIDQKAQHYNAVPLRHETSHVGLPFLESFSEGGGSWWGYPPYGNGGGSVAGENPVVWVTEFYVTPFDRLLRREPENSVVSNLAAGQVVGFRMTVGDFDEPGTSGPESNFPGKPHVLGDYFGMTANEYAVSKGDLLMDGILLPANGIDGGDSAVKPDSWARIKASFSQ